MYDPILVLGLIQIQTSTLLMNVFIYLKNVYASFSSTWKTVYKNKVIDKYVSILRRYNRRVVSFFLSFFCKYNSIQNWNLFHGNMNKANLQYFLWHMRDKYRYHPLSHLRETYYGSAVDSKIISKFELSHKFIILTIIIQ